MEKIKLIKLLEETNDVSLLDKYSDSEDNEIRFTVIMNQNISKDLLYKRFYLEEDKKNKPGIVRENQKIKRKLFGFHRCQSGRSHNTILSQIITCTWF